MHIYIAIFIKYPQFFGKKFNPQKSHKAKKIHKYIYGYKIHTHFVTLPYLLLNSPLQGCHKKISESTRF